MAFEIEKLSIKEMLGIPRFFFCLMHESTFNCYNAYLEINYSLNDNKRLVSKKNEFCALRS